ncbi:MAG: hypothetical protein LBP78_01090 [Acidaminococcales bacterium]|jgi:hypothetical protein|nr:hypothetical protein [Acidaminococcales bacterium]
MAISFTKLAYGNSNDNYANGVIDQISDNAASPTIDLAVVTGLPFDPQNPEPLGGDPRVLGFTDGSGNERALVINYNYSGWDPGTAEFGIFDPSTTPWTSVAVRTNTQWSKLTNPYGIARLDNANMFVADYDGGLIDKITLTNYAEVLTGGNAFYTFPVVSGNTAHCAGIGVYDGKIVALFNQGQGYSSYIASTLAIINPSDGSAVYLGPTSNNPNASGLGANALGLTVDGGYAYVSSYGGPQQGGGNAASKVEAVNLSNLTIVGTTSSSAGDLGDFVSTAVNGTDAYVLRASYTASYDQYDYKIYKTTTADLQAGTVDLTDYFLLGQEPPNAGDESYPGVTWLLAYANGRLWAVLGDRIAGIDPATPGIDWQRVAYTDTSTTPATANTLGYYSTQTPPIADHINTAAVVQTNVPAPTVTRGVTRGAPAAPSYSVSNRGAQHPAFISRTPEALALRKKLIEEWKKNKK